jgi:hypothetical protein
MSQQRLFQEEEEEDALLDRVQNMCENGIAEDSDDSMNTIFGQLSFGNQSTVTIQNTGQVSTGASYQNMSANSFSSTIVASPGLTRTDNTFEIDNTYRYDQMTLRKHFGEIKNPKEGTLIMDGLDNSLKFYNGTHWEVVAQGQQRGLDL